VFKALEINATDEEIKAVLKHMDRDSKVLFNLKLSIILKSNIYEIKQKMAK
jgi:hypothetical protein